MQQIMPQHNHANLGWLFYKHYFEANDRDAIDTTGVADTLDNRNYTITQRVFANTDMAFQVRSQNKFILETTYPGLLIGSGYTHEYDKGRADKDSAFKIGFFFDYATGMPCIPGHSIKGVLRSAFPNHKEEKYPDEKAEFIVDCLKEFSVDAEGCYNEYMTAKNITNAPYTPLRFACLAGDLIFEGLEPYRWDEKMAHL